NNLARLFFHASSRFADSRGIEEPTRFISPGSPVLVIEYEPHEARALPVEARAVDSAHTGGPPLSFARLSNEGKEFGTWFIRRDRDRLTATRNLRLAILRLHAEQQVLKRIIHQISTGAIAFHPRTEQGDKIQFYLLNALKILERNEWHG